MHEWASFSTIHGHVAIGRGLLFVRIEVYPSGRLGIMLSRRNVRRFLSVPTAWKRYRLLVDYMQQITQLDKLEKAGW